MATKKTAAALTIPGSPPPPLPEVEPALVAWRDELAAIEALTPTEPRASQLRAEEFEQRNVDADLAQRFLRVLPREFGDPPPSNPDYSAAKTPAQRKALDAATMARVFARSARERTFAVLHAIAARDPDFQGKALATLDEWSGGSHLLRGALYAALVRAPVLSPPLAEHVRRVALEKPPKDLTAGAIFAAFRHGFADELLWPSVEQRSTTADFHHAKLVIDIGSSGGHFARDPERWRPRFEELQKLADLQYDWSKLEEAQASRQLGLSARQALASLASAPKVAPAPLPKKQSPTRATIATPVDRKKLRTPKAREAALDALGAWIVDELAFADDARAREVIAAAIATFYDIREAAGQEREEYAGHFFMADGVGLGDTGRPVPWAVLGERVGDDRIDALRELFLEVEKTIH